MGGSISKELTLANELRSICNENGKEKDTKKSANIFHQLGIIYKGKSFDKIKLIRSAALLNAAIARQQSNDEFKNDLEQLCSHVLEVAGAENTKANLIKISREVGLKVKDMRESTNKSLDKFQASATKISRKHVIDRKDHQIEFVRNIQNKITDDYTEIMDYISKQCIEIMGNPPCRYAVVGMGSLARKEITPYSDFEHVIVLEEGVQHKDNYDVILEFFRWFTVIFQIIIINLKETILPSVAIPWLNDFSIPDGDWFFDAHTTRGISFDGIMPQACKLPLGRTQETENKSWTTELIKPVSEMVKYLETDEDVKNGYHLADILTKTCFVSGHRDVYNRFQERVSQKLSRRQPLDILQLMSQLEDDLIEYNADVCLTNFFVKVQCNIKKTIYRSISLFVAFLGRFYAINKHSCFEIIHGLKKRKLINAETEKRLQYALFVACLTRLKVYMSKKRQDDFIGERDFIFGDNKTLNELMRITGEQPLIEYFITVHSLQEILRTASFKELKDLKCKLSNRFFVLFFLGQEKLIITEWEKFLKLKQHELQVEDLLRICCSVIDVYHSTGQFDKSLHVIENFSKQLSDVDEERLLNSASTGFGVIILYIKKAELLHNLQCYEDSSLYAEQCLKKLKKCEVQADFRMFALASLINTNGQCKRMLHLDEEAITLFKQSIKHCDEARDGPIVVSLIKINSSYSMAYCYFNLRNYDQAVDMVTASIASHHSSSSPVSNLCKSYKLLVECYSRLNQPDQAAYYLQLLLEHATTTM